MKGRAFKTALILLFLCLTSLTPQGEKRLPKVKVFTVYREQVAELWQFLTTSPRKYQVIDLRVGIAYLTTDLQNLIKSWVEKGGGIIVYAGADDEGDSASVFFENDIEYASLNRWEPVILKAVGNHPLLKGVSRIKLFIYRIPDIKNLMGKIPLFQMEDGKVAAFAFQYGSGRGIYLPTGPLIPYFPVDQYDNRRFFINAYQWLAGNPVPD